jgi:hypothetical protein
MCLCLQGITRFDVLYILWALFDVRRQIFMWLSVIKVFNRNVIDSTKLQYDQAVFLSCYGGNSFSKQFWESTWGEVLCLCRWSNLCRSDTTLTQLHCSVSVLKTQQLLCRAVGTCSVVRTLQQHCVNRQMAVEPVCTWGCKELHRLGKTTL